MTPLKGCSGLGRVSCANAGAFNKALSTMPSAKDAPLYFINMVLSWRWRIVRNPGNSSGDGDSAASDHLGVLTSYHFPNRVCLHDVAGWFTSTSSRSSVPVLGRCMCEPRARSPEHLSQGPRRSPDLENKSRLNGSMRNSGEYARSFQIEFPTAVACDKEVVTAREAGSTGEYAGAKGTGDIATSSGLDVGAGFMPARVPKAHVLPPKSRTIVQPRRRKAGAYSSRSKLRIRRWRLLG